MDWAISRSSLAFRFSVDSSPFVRNDLASSLIILHSLLLRTQLRGLSSKHYHIRFVRGSVMQFSLQSCGGSVLCVEQQRTKSSLISKRMIQFASLLSFSCGSHLALEHNLVLRYLSLDSIHDGIGRDIVTQIQKSSSYHLYWVLRSISVTLYTG